MNSELQEEVTFLFHTARQWLLEREIVFGFTSAEIEWVLKKFEIPEYNETRAISGFWHKKVGNVIEDLILQGKVKAGDTLAVHSNFVTDDLEFETIPKKES